MTRVQDFGVDRQSLLPLAATTLAGAIFITDTLIDLEIAVAVRWLAANAPPSLRDTSRFP